MRAYNQSMPDERPQHHISGQTALWCSRAQRYRSMERSKRTRERTRQRWEYPVRSIYHCL